MKSQKLNEAKELSRGVFWVIDDELYAYPYAGADCMGVAKSGLTYNHEKLWKYVKPKGCNKPYNYYPRGRVDITNKGKAVIYLNPNIDEKFIKAIKLEFGIRDEPDIKYDFSKHYQCHLDDNTIN